MDKINIDKVKLESSNIADENFEKLASLFPNVVTETIVNDRVERAIDIEKLKQEINAHILSENEERYNFSWPDKRKSVVLANAPTRNTLRACKEESKDFDKTENLYIEGDNLEVLKLLRNTYIDYVDVIYIDPPYNTGNDILYINSFYDSYDEFQEKYNIDKDGNRLYLNTLSDGRFHTNWLNMMYSRIKISRDILKKTGLFLIAIDHNELFNIGQLCDEIFGYSNRIGIITVVHKPEGRNQAKFIGPSNEFMLVYAKNIEYAQLQKVVLDDELAKLYCLEDSNGAYRLKNFIRLSDGKYSTRINKPTFWYPIYVSFDLKEITIHKKDNYYEIFPITDTGIERTWKTTKDTFMERVNNGDIVAIKQNNSIIIYEKLREEQVIKTHWIDKKYHGYHYGTKIIDELLKAKTFDFPKSLFLMKDIIKLFCPNNGLCIDFFSGSATTAHAVMQLNAEDGGNRKYIMVQLPAETPEDSEARKAGYNTICEIGKERIRRAGEKIKKDYPNANIDTGFRVFKLDSSNMEDVYYKAEDLSQQDISKTISNIKADRSNEDLLFQIILSFGIKLTCNIEVKKVNNRDVYFVDNTYLLVCFEKDIDEKTIEELAKKEPRFMVFNQNMHDSTLANIEQIFKLISPTTIMNLI